MIKNIIKALKENPGVSDYKIIETSTISNQAFFVLGKLETTRLENTTEYEITVFNRHDEKIGYSSFNINHKLSKKELNSKIDKAVYASSFVNNKDFELLIGSKAKKVNGKAFEDSFETILENVDKIIRKHSTTIKKYNALEVFYNIKKIHLVNSKGINFSGSEYSLELESIPSYDGNEKVEVYKFDKYSSLNYVEIENDVIEHMNDVTMRANAKKIDNINKIDVVLKGNDVEEFIYSTIEDYNYAQVYNGSTTKKIGDKIGKSNINISLKPISKSLFFDSEGNLLKKIDIVKKGTLVNYFGSSQYAQYLNMECNGWPKKIEVKKGNKEKGELLKDRYLEIITLSGIQIEPYSDYIGGEIRLAVLHENGESFPVSGISFSGSFKKSLNSLELSKETVDTYYYSGPKYIRIKNMNIL